MAVLVLFCFRKEETEKFGGTINGIFAQLWKLNKNIVDFQGWGNTSAFHEVTNRVYIKECQSMKHSFRKDKKL